mmetsp:Transcript_29542/g.33864  ORF Transcript_29542/g.33864 Transcript_29542/m.33864 type:complete len:86 (+) Transcript_29542:516-773(+)
MTVQAIPVPIMHSPMYIRSSDLSGSWRIFDGAKINIEAIRIMKPIMILALNSNAFIRIGNTIGAERINVIVGRAKQNPIKVLLYP